MTLDILNNPAQLSEQREKINSAIEAVNTGINATPVTADAPFVLTDAGGTFANNTTTNHSKALVAGLGHVVLEQSSTGTLSVTQGSATALTGVTATTATQRRVWLTEVSPGVYQGSAASIPILGDVVTHNAAEFATAAQGAKADSAVQPGALGTAASRAATDFASSVQGAKADSAVQSVKTVNGKSLAGTGDAGLVAADVGAAPAGTGAGGAVTAADAGSLATATIAITNVNGGTAFSSNEAGKSFTNATATNYTRSLIPGLGQITFVQNGTGTLGATLGTATSLGGMTSTSASNPCVTFYEVGTGVYVGVATPKFPMAMTAASGGTPDAASLAALAAAGVVKYNPAQFFVMPPATGGDDTAMIQAVWDAADAAAASMGEGQAACIDYPFGNIYYTNGNEWPKNRVIIRGNYSVHLKYQDPTTVPDSNFGAGRAVCKNSVVRTIDVPQVGTTYNIGAVNISSRMGFQSTITINGQDVSSQFTVGKQLIIAGNSYDPANKIIPTVFGSVFDGTNTIVTLNASIPAGMTATGTVAIVSDWTRYQGCQVYDLTFGSNGFNCDAQMTRTLNVKDFYFERVTWIHSSQQKGSWATCNGGENIVAYMCRIINGTQVFQDAWHNQYGRNIRWIGGALISGDDCLPNGFDGTVDQYGNAVNTCNDWGIDGASAIQPYLIAGGTIKCYKGAAVDPLSLYRGTVKNVLIDGAQGYAGLQRSGPIYVTDDNSNTYAVTSVVSGTNGYFMLAGDVRIRFVVGKAIALVGNGDSASNQNYIVIQCVLNGGNTQVFVDSIPGTVSTSTMGTLTEATAVPIASMNSGSNFASTGSTITGNTLNIGTLTSGTISIGQQISGTGVANGTVITGGAGSTWTVNINQTVASTAISGVQALGTITLAGYWVNRFRPGMPFVISGNSNVVPTWLQVFMCVYSGGNTIITVPYLPTSISGATTKGSANFPRQKQVERFRCLNFDLVHDTTNHDGSNPYSVFMQYFTDCELKGSITVKEAGNGGTFSGTGSIAGNVLTLTSISAGQATKGQTISGTGVSPKSVITGQLTGTPGGAGTYSVNLSQTVASTAISGVGIYIRYAIIQDFDGFKWDIDCPAIPSNGGVFAQVSTAAKMARFFRMYGNMRGQRIDPAFNAAPNYTALSLSHIDADTTGLELVDLYGDAASSFAGAGIVVTHSSSIGPFTTLKMFNGKIMAQVGMTNVTGILPFNAGDLASCTVTAVTTNQYTNWVQSSFSTFVSSYTFTGILGLGTPMHAKGATSIGPSQTSYQNVTLNTLPRLGYGGPADLQNIKCFPQYGLGAANFLRPKVIDNNTVGFSLDQPAGMVITAISTGFTSTASSISGTVLTVGGTITGTVAVGQMITGTGIAANTVISSLGTGTGGAGTYNLSITNGTIASEAINGSPTITVSGERNDHFWVGGICSISGNGDAATNSVGTAQNITAIGGSATAATVTVAGNQTAQFPANTEAVILGNTGALLANVQWTCTGSSYGTSTVITLAGGAPSGMNATGTIAPLTSYTIGGVTYVGGSTIVALPGLRGTVSTSTTGRVTPNLANPSVVVIYDVDASFKQ